MYDYYLRCKEGDIEQLIQLATILGVIEIVDGLVQAKDGGMWDYIGYKFVGEAPAEGEPDLRTIAGIEGENFIHINVRTPINVKEVATALATENPAIAAGLAQIPRFFIVDAEGNATAPEYPLRVWL